MGPLSVVPAVHPAKAVRDAAEACDLAYQRFNNAFLQNAKVYASLAGRGGRRHRPPPAARGASTCSRTPGVALAPAARARAQRLNAELTKLHAGLSAVRNHDTVVFTEAELDGVPCVWHNAGRDARLDPSADLVIERAVQERTRERMWRATIAPGRRPTWKTTLQRIARGATSPRRCSGFGSAADFTMRRRMVKSAPPRAAPSRVGGRRGGRARARRPGVLREAGAGHGAAAGEHHAAARWDMAYHRARVRLQRYAVDQKPSALLPAAAQPGVRLRRGAAPVSLRGLLTQTLWHEQAQAYVVRDGNGTLLQTVRRSVPAPRRGTNRAAVWSFRNVATKSGRAGGAGQLDRRK